MSEQDGLVPTEGVDEGSAASAAERAGSGARDVLGAPVSGAPDTPEAPAPPVDAESDTSHAAREQRGTGQQLQQGEG